MEKEQHLLESGQVVWTHSRSECIGDWCSIHQPRPGPWSSWERYWRDDRGVMERVCPHGVGHPAAEMYEWARYMDPSLLVHGCDGCPCCPLPDVDDTQVLARFLEEPKEDSMTQLEQDALDLLLDLWPKPPYATVVLETHQWIKLRRTILALLGR